MEYHGTFHIGQRENLRYNFDTAHKKIARGAFIVFLAVLILVGVTRFAAGGDVRAALLAALPYAAGGAALLLAANYALIYVRVRMMYNRKAVSAYTQELRLDASGVHIGGATGQTDMAWEQLVDTAETRRDFYLYIHAASAYLIPKEQLERPEDADTIRRILKTYAQKPQGRRKS